MNSKADYARSSSADTRTLHAAPTPIAAIVTAHKRIEQTLTTIGRIKQCTPPPDAIFVHVDDNQFECTNAIRKTHPDVEVIESAICVGPGGGRNKLIQASAYPTIASFDDDSYPLDLNYFGRVAEIFGRFPEASVLCAQIYHRGQRIEQDTKTLEAVADFCGAGCAYQRDVFLLAGGYVPVPVAYGMEEVDLALRLHAQNQLVLRSSWLRVFHDTDLAHHTSRRINSAGIANAATLAYLRYPVILWPIGIWQLLNRIRYSLRMGRRHGLLAGLASIPAELFKYRRYTRRLPAKKVWSYLQLRRKAIPMNWDRSAHGGDDLKPKSPQIELGS